MTVWAWLLRTEPDPGLSNVRMSLGWQAIAGLLAFAIWGVGWGLPKSNGIRRMSSVPLVMARFVAVLAGFGVI